MPSMVHVGLEAEGQALAIVQAPPALASGAVDRIVFDVKLSEEWEGLEGYTLLMRSQGGVYACEIVDGTAYADARAVASDGVVEVCIFAQRGADRMTSGIATVSLYNSGL